MKSSVLIAGLCGLALAGAGCGDDDNDALSYDDTGTEIGDICKTVSFDGLNGEPANDAPVLEETIPEFEDAIQQVQDLDVDEELASIRDDFVDNANQQVVIIKEGQTAAENGDKQAYHQKLNSIDPLDKESDDLANQLGADGCLEE